MTRVACDEQFTRYLLLRAVDGALLVAAFLPAPGEYLLALADGDTPLASFLLVADAPSALATALQPHRVGVGLLLGELPDALRACGLAFEHCARDPLVRTSERTADVRLRVARPTLRHESSLQLLEVGGRSRTVTDSLLQATFDVNAALVRNVLKLRDERTTMNCSNMPCAQLVLNVRFERDGLYVLRVCASAESARPPTLVFSCVFLVRLRLSLCVHVRVYECVRK